MRSAARLTRQGYGALGVGAVVAVIGLRLGYSGVAAFGLALLGFVIFTLIALQRTPPLQVRRDTSPASPRRLDDGTVTLTVRNRGRRAARLDGSEMMGRTELEVYVPYVTPGRTIQVRYPLSTERRGEVVLGPLRVKRLGLAGLAAGRVSLPGTHTVTVLPRVLPAAWPGGPITVLVDDRAASYPPDTRDFDEAVDVAVSLIAATAAAGFPFTVRTAVRTTLAGPPRGSGDRVATAVTQLATLSLVTLRAEVPAVGGAVAVGVTGSAGDPSPLLAALSTAARAVLLVVDRRPDQMVAAVTNVLTLRAPRAEELLVAWADVVPTTGDTARSPRWEIA